jgi:hypothetical protein
VGVLAGVAVEDESIAGIVTDREPVRRLSGVERR